VRHTDLFRDKKALPYLLIIPSVVLILSTIIYPVFYAFTKSLHLTRYMETIRFVGLANYLRFFSSPQNLRNILNSFVYVLGSLALTMPLALSLAILVRQRFRFRFLVRSVLITPWVISQTIVAMLWMWLLNPYYGPINAILQKFGLLSVDFLGTTQLAMPSLIAINVWRSYPLAMILLLAALQSIPEEIYEAAAVDGASAFTILWRVTLPMIKPTILITLILLTFEYFNMVTLIFVLTGGGPADVTTTLSLRVFREAFINWNIGFASAVGIIIFIVNAIFATCYFRLFRTESYY
jgi:multiple sugar transport system permease protein